MSGRILVVDDVPSNVKLLEAGLEAEYFEVISALSGQECLIKVAEQDPDIVLLDVMMPDMDGMEVCRRIKSDPKTAHLPVVMVTALNQTSVRVASLEAGADDFLTKPVERDELLVRVRSLVRLKAMTDELRTRENTAQSLGLIDSVKAMTEPDPIGNILLVADGTESARWFESALAPMQNVTTADTFEEALIRVKGGDPDLVVINLSMRCIDGLRLCSQLRSLPEGRGVPILVIVSQGDHHKLLLALKMGVNDYLIHPVDKYELGVRVRTQLRKKRYADQLRHNVQLGLEAAIIDQLTGLHNRRYMNHHLRALLANSSKKGSPLSLVIIDIDFFKRANDTHGHDMGDEALREFAARIKANVRAIDLTCRYGGEEFVIAMPDTEIATAHKIAERLRKTIETTPVKISRAPHQINFTISIGVAQAEGDVDSAEALLTRADQALCRAKQSGRNRVVADAA